MRAVLPFATMPSLAPWTPALLVLALLLAVGWMWLRGSRRPNRKALPNEWALTSRPVFSHEERRAYRHLREALPQHVVLSKLPLVRFCQPTRTQEVRYWYDLLGTSHVAFAICSASGRVLAAIDLENDRASRRSMQIKQAVLEACRVRYLRCVPDALPTAVELQAMMPVPVLGNRMPPTPSPVVQTRERLASTVASKRQERAQNQWPDSNSIFDSRFSNSMLPAPGPLDDGGGRVVDNAPPVLRH